MNGGLKVGLLEGKRRSYSRSLADGNTVLGSGCVYKVTLKLTDFHLIYRQLQSTQSTAAFNSLLFIPEALSCMRDKNDCIQTIINNLNIDLPHAIFVSNDFQQKRLMECFIHQ